MAVGKRELLEYSRDVLSASPEYLWARLPEAYVLRNPMGGKWFAVGMPVRRDRLGLSGTGEVEVLNLKCGEVLLGSLLGRPGFLPAYHMSKAQWVSVLLDGTVGEKEIKNLLSVSYDLTASKKKAKRAE